MVGGTSFHRGILQASVGRMSTKSNRKTKSCLRSKNQNLGFGSTARMQPPRTLYVSLDNADSVIEGGPFKPSFGLSGALEASAGAVRETSFHRPPPALWNWNPALA